MFKNVVSESAAKSAPSSANLQRAFDLCVRKTRGNIKRLADHPRSAPWAVDGNYFAHPEGFNEIGNWTSSFFTGMALIAWRETEDEYFLEQTLRLAPAYRGKAFTENFHSHHDMGFLYSLYSVGLHKLTGDSQHRETGLRAAQALYQRFNAAGNFIRAWGAMNTDEQANMAIIDCLMNLPLLYWASIQSGDPRFRDVAIRHADTTLKCFVRPDDSVFHAFLFDPESGESLGGENHCGRAVESHWARGTGWAIYGFAISHRYTGDARYLDAALRLARKFNQELNSDALPVWDFKLPPGEPLLRDASAAAVVACAYQELEKLGAADALMVKTKDSLLQALCADAYLNFDEACPGVLKDGQVGINGPGTAQNAYTSWGDYFLMEALDRELHNGETWW